MHPLFKCAPTQKTHRIGSPQSSYSNVFRHRGGKLGNTSLVIRWVVVHAAPIHTSSQADMDQGCDGERGCWTKNMGIGPSPGANLLVGVSSLTLSVLRGDTSHMVPKLGWNKAQDKQ